MAEVKRKKGETFESLLRRFHKKLQQSGRLIQSRKIRFFEKDSNQTKKRKQALRRIEITAKRDYLQKIGKLKEEPRKRRFR